MTTPRWLFKRVFYGVGVFLVVGFCYAGLASKVLADETITSADPIFSQFADGYIGVQGNLVLDDLTIPTGRTWKFSGSSGIQLNPGVTFQGKVTLQLAACGWMGGPCCSDSSCSSGLSCINSLCVQNARGFVADHWGRDYSRSIVQTSATGLCNYLDSIKGGLDSAVQTHDPDGDWIPPATSPYDNSCTLFPTLQNWYDHIQGINRIPGLYNDSCIVRTLDNQEDPGGKSQVFLTCMSWLQNTGGYAFNTGYHDGGDTVITYETGMLHTGGVSISGQIVATVSEEETEGTGPEVLILDFSTDKVAYLVGGGDCRQNNGAILADFEISWLALGFFDYGSNPSPPSSSGAVALGRLASGRFILIVEGHSGHDPREFWIYLSDQRYLTPQTTWTFHNYLTIDTKRQAENIQFLTSTNGDVYFSALANNAGDLDVDNCDITSVSAESNVIDIKQLVLSSSGKLTLENKCESWNWEDNCYCSFRFGGGIYVNPSGKPIVYCEGRSWWTQAPNYRFGEHSH